MFLKIWTKKSTADYSESIGRLKEAGRRLDDYIKERVIDVWQQWENSLKRR